MMENAISSSSLYSPGSTLNYSQAAMMGLTGSHGSLPDTQQLGYPSHSGIPNIILTGEATRQGVLRAGRCPCPRGSLAGDGIPALAQTHGGQDPHLDSLLGLQDTGWGYTS